MAQAGTGDAREYKVVLVDNDALVLGLLSSIVSKRAGLKVSWTARGGEEALESYRRCAASINCMPDLIVTDISMRGMSGFELASAIRFEDARTPILGMTSYAAAVYEQDAFDSGMQGIVEKDEVARLLRACCLLLKGMTMARADGSPYEVPGHAHARMASREKPAMLLSDNEREVMDLCVKGYSTRQIAELLNTTQSTVKTYVSRAVRKLDVRNRREAVALWARKTGVGG
ncbi:MAG: response regulator transcription factor [Bifidobacterium sp.]|nr:response regulator transcription factor [Bifidobacterium sp.]